MTDPLLNALRHWAQFVIVWFAPLPNGKADKIPCGPTGQRGVDAHDARNWLSLSAAQAMCATLGAGYGLGFVLTREVDIATLDIDAAVLPNGQWDDRVLIAHAALPGAIFEISHSGTGAHFWMKGAHRIPPEQRKKNTLLKLELYREKRFIALGRFGSVGPDELQDVPQLVQYAEQFLPLTATTTPGVAGEGPRPEWCGPADDDELIERGRRLQASMGVALGNQAHFADLWDGNVEVLARCYPASSDSSSTAYDGSSVDLAFVNALAYLTGCDRPRMRRLLERWCLRRDKHEREDYLEATFSAACWPGRPVLRDLPSATAEVKPAETPQDARAEASPFVDEDAARQMFSGHTYVLAENRVLTPRAQMLTEAQFNAWFGNYRFKQGEKVIAKAWEAFVRSTATHYPRAHDVFFSPALKFGALQERDGLTLVNAFQPANVRRVPGDIDPFMRHLKKLLPHDWRVWWNWAKRIVQTPGFRPNYALVIQGVEGCGKSFLAQFLEFALGERLVARPNAANVSGQFNSWLGGGKLLVVIEDTPQKQRDGSDIVEALKVMVTARRFPVEAKGVDPKLTDLLCAFVLETNYQSAVRKTKNDRRIAPLFCAQQSEEDLTRDGMGRAYFQELLDWRDAGGFEAVAHALATEPVEYEYDPAGACMRAPTTSATTEAIAASADQAVLAVQEAIDLGLEGFRGGWVSSAHVGSLLERKRLSHLYPVGPRRTALYGLLGLKAHPGLPENGKASTFVPGPDGATVRPRLYLSPFSDAFGLAGPQAIVSAYLLAQQTAP